VVADASASAYLAQTAHAPVAVMLASLATRHTPCTGSCQGCGGRCRHSLQWLLIHVGGHPAPPFSLHWSLDNCGDASSWHSRVTASQTIRVFKAVTHYALDSNRCCLASNSALGALVILSVSRRQWLLRHSCVSRLINPSDGRGAIAGPEAWVWLSA
jgi:hypothetical protein